LRQPVTALRSGRAHALGGPQWPTPPAGVDAMPPIGSNFVLALALYIVVAVPKTNALLPALDVFKPGKILAVLVLLTALTTPLADRLRAVFRTRVAKAGGLITLLMIVGVPFSIWPGHSLGYFRDQGLQTFFLFALAAAAFTDRRAVPVLATAWVLGAGLGALRMLAPGALSVQGRVMMSVAFDPNDSAALLVCTLPFALWMSSRRGLSRVAGIVTALASVLAIVRSGSRGGLIGLAIIGLFMLYVAPPRRRLAFVAAALVGALVVSFTASDDLRARMKSVFSDDAKQEDYNFTDRDGRIEIWKRGIGYMVARPLLGVGVDGFETAEGTLGGKQNEGFGIRYAAAHNSFVQIGAELGVFGLASYIAAILFAATGLLGVRKRALRARQFVPALADQELALTAAAISALIGITTTGFFLSFGYHPITMFVWAVCIGVIVGSPFARDVDWAASGSPADLPAADDSPAVSVAEVRPTPLPRGTPGWRSRAR